MDLERARDELLYEVHKQNASTMEKDIKVLRNFQIGSNHQENDSYC